MALYKVSARGWHAFLLTVPLIVVVGYMQYAKPGFMALIASFIFLLPYIVFAAVMHGDHGKKTWRAIQFLMLRYPLYCSLFYLFGTIYMFHIALIICAVTAMIGFGFLFTLLPATWLLQTFKIIEIISPEPKESVAELEKDSLT